MRGEKFEVASYKGKVMATFKSQEILRKFIGVVEDLVKSEVFNSHYEEAKELIEFMMELKKAQREFREYEDLSTGYSEDEIKDELEL